MKRTGNSKSSGAVNIAFDYTIFFLFLEPETLIHHLELLKNQTREAVELSFMELVV